VTPTERSTDPTPPRAADAPASPAPVSPASGSAGPRAEEGARAGGADDIGSWEISPLRHWGRWVSAVVILALLALLARSFANAAIDWSVVRSYLTSGAIFSGFLHTVLLSVLAMLVGSFLGLIFAVMRMSKNRVANSVAWLYVWLFRGTPVLLQLLLWFNLAIVFPTLSVPGLWHDRTINVISPFVAALLGLGVNEGAYLTEAFRSGILSVDEGQEEASTALGLSRFQALRFVIMPQALRVILPPFGNESIGMLKTTSLAAVIAYPELLEAAEKVYYVNSRIIELLLVAGVWYLVATSLLTIGQYYAERRLARSLARARPRSSIEQLIIHGLNQISGRRNGADKTR
jgi:polar amino acid transport system permease protein